MKFNNLIKVLAGLSCLTSAVFAGDCDDIKEYLKDKKDVDKIIEECVENDGGKVTTLKINNIRLSLSQKNINKLISYDTLSVLEYKYNQEYLFNIQWHIEESTDCFYDKNTGIIVSAEKTNYEIVPEITVPSFNIDSLTKLTELKIINYSFSNAYINPYFYGWFKPYLSIIPSNNVFKLPKSIKKLSIQGIKLNQEYIDTIATLNNLEELNFSHCNYDDLKLNSLKNIPSIIIEDENNYGVYGSIPKNVISQFSNVKNLTLKHIELDGYMLKEIGGLKNLEELTLQICMEIDFYSYMSARPACLYGATKCYDIQRNDLNWNDLKSLSKLKSLTIVDGKITDPKEVLQDMDNLKNYKFSNNDVSTEYYDLLFRQQELIENINQKYQDNDGSVIGIKPSEFIEIHNETEEPAETVEPSNAAATTTTTTTTITTTTTTRTKKSTTKKTTTTRTKKSTTKKTTTTTKKSTTTSSKPSLKGRCGEGIGKCSSGYCCSKYGYCGKTDEYCSKGCQSEFGDCKNTKTTTTKKTKTKTTTTKKTTTSSEPSVKGRCGKEYGKCPSGHCCSKYGWCGKSDDHCSVSRGCQSKFGKCQ